MAARFLCRSERRKHHGTNLLPKSEADRAIRTGVHRFEQSDIAPFFHASRRRTAYHVPAVTVAACGMKGYKTRMSGFGAAVGLVFPLHHDLLGVSQEVLPINRFAWFN